MIKIKIIKFIIKFSFIFFILILFLKFYLKIKKYNIIIKIIFLY